MIFYFEWIYFLFVVIEEYHKTYTHTEWLVIHDNVEMTRFMKEMTGGIGTRMLRTIFVSEVACEMPLKDRMKTAALMYHKLTTSLSYHEKE